MGNFAATTALFVADSHFCLEPSPAEQRRVARFLAFLDFARRADHLVLLGDIFDFWFDLPHFRLKGYEALLQGLDRVRDAGTLLHFVGGNHDIWAADYLRERYGCLGDGSATTLELGGLRVRLDHGAGFLARGLLYRLFRSLVRRRAAAMFAKSLHPEALYAFATWLSGTSRKATRDEVALIRQRAALKLAAAGDEPWDLLIIGHVHHAFMAEHGPRRLACLDGWLDSEGYGVLVGREFALRDFARDPLPDLPGSQSAG